MGKKEKKRGKKAVEKRAETKCVLRINGRKLWSRASTRVPTLPSSPATVNKASPNIFIFAPPLRVTVVSLSNAIYLYHRFYDAFVERKRVRLLKKKRRKKKRKREEATDRKHALILASLVVPISAFLEARRIISSRYFFRNF